MSEERKPRALPPSDLDALMPAIVERLNAYPQLSYGEPEPEDQGTPLSHYLWILKRHKWKMLAFVVTSVLCTVVVSSRLTPIYEAVASIDIDRQSPAGVLGQDASRVALNDSEQFLATQIKTIQSDSVLRPVVQRYHLKTAGSEEQESKVPTTRAAEAPIALRNLKVTRPVNTYLLLINYRSPDPQLAADVSNGIAQSYIEHTYNIRIRSSAGLSAFMEKQIAELKAKMEQSSAALAQFERELNVINPEEKTSMLTSRLMQLNTEFTTAQGDRMRKEAAFMAVQNGSLEAVQASEQGGEQIRKVAERLDEAREKFVSIRTMYGAKHPEYRKAASQVAELERQLEALKKNIMERVIVDYQKGLRREKMLQKAVADTKTESDRLNVRSYEYKSLQREAEADKKLYEELNRKIKEAGINASFQNSSIRLSDPARPPLKPVFPDLRMNGLLALLFSAMLAVGAAVLSDTLDHTVRDPEQIQRGMNTEVIGALPVVKSWRGRLPAAMNGGSPGGALVKVGVSGGQHAAFDEAVRTLRDSILLPDLDRRPRSLLITSATPREGKSTTAAHLAVAHSQQKRKTLLIDADLRQPSLYRHFGLSNEKGLSDVIKGETDWRAALQPCEAYPYLHVLPSGPASRRAADTVGSTLRELLMEASADYDLVIVDGPPLLGFAEPLQMASVVEGVVVVALAGQTDRNAVASVLNSLKRVKANVIGVTLNEVRRDMSDQYYYYGYYGTYYSRYYKPTKG